MRPLAIAVLMLAPLLAPAAHASDEPSEVPALVAAVGAAAAARFSEYAEDPRALDAFVLAQLEQQGAVEAGTLGAALARPEHVYKDVHPVCDLTGDGIGDMVSNDIEFNSPPGQTSGPGILRAIDGATGEPLWSQDNLFYSRPAAARAGLAYPTGADNLASTMDLDGDGLCDLLTFGYDTDPSGISVPPLFEVASVSTFYTVIRLLSGKDGSTVWESTVPGMRVSAREPVLSTSRHTTSFSMPSGFLPFVGPAGPGLVLKFTDLNQTTAVIPQILNPAFVRQLYGSDPFRGDLFVETLSITERVQMIDAASGALVWERSLGGAADARFTNMSWLAGVADFTGDGELDVLLDQMTIANPRGTELNQPMADVALFEFGRGMRLTALDGTDGATHWSIPVVDPLAVNANPPQEESHEVLSFTSAAPTSDLDGDGIADAIASYVMQEQALGTTIEGAFRTHFVPVSGVNGTMLWDVRQQGWGYARTLDGGPDAPATRIGLGMLDIPTPVQAGRFPPKFVRLVALDAASGEVEWSYERAFAQNSYLSYNQALAQYRDALAPYDWDGDGLLDLVTPSQYNAATGFDQVLLAASTHTYEIKSGADGSTLATVTAWGPEGRVVACGDESARHLTVAGGHARRYDLQRYDPATGAQVWRHALFNDPAPRAAASGIDLTGAGIRCAQSDDATVFSANLYLFSKERRSEIVPLRGLLRDDTAAWVEPPVEGEPSNDIMLARVPTDEELAARQSVSWTAIALAAALGAAAAVATFLLARRVPGLRKLVGVGIVLLVVTPGLASALGGAPALAGPAIDGFAAPAPVVADDADPSAKLASDLLHRGRGLTPAHIMGAAVEHLRAMGVQTPPPPANDTAPGFHESISFSYTYRLPDVDGDGTEDLAFDTYCDALFTCGDNAALQDDPVRWLAYYNCEVPHNLHVISGATGRVLWRLDLTTVTLATQCGRAFVMGTVPTPDGGLGFIVYTQVVDGPVAAEFFVGPFLFQHEISLIDARTGLPLWTHTETGHYEAGWMSTASAESVLTIPVIMAARGGETAVFVQSIGFVATAASDIGLLQVVPYGPLRNDVVVLDQYDPKEWAARIDLATGAFVWKVDTFQPTPPVSTLPRLSPLFPDAYYMYRQMDAEYWDDTACCGDLTGDGVPDIVYRVLEWSALPNTNVDGPYFLDARLQVRDGATGAIVADAYVREDIEGAMTSRGYPAPTQMHGSALTPNYGLIVEPIADATGDGIADLVVREPLVKADYTHYLSVYDGKTLAPQWTIESPRNLRVAQVGDADGDGAADLLLVDWYDREAGTAFDDEYVTPAETPLRLVSGADGHVIWRAVTYQAPIDVVLYYDTLLRNGLPDVDGDGVGDVIVDDPLYLGDQTVIHRNRVLSGRTGEQIRLVETVGAFSLPARVDDMTSDARDDLVVLSGDLNDLWMTLVDGAAGTPVWSRRLVALPVSSPAEALPQLKYHVLRVAGDAVPDLGVNMHLDIESLYTFNSVYVTNSGVSASTQTGTFAYMQPQFLRLDGARARLDWAVPPMDAGANVANVVGATPGAKAYEQFLATAQAGAVEEARAAIPRAVPLALAFFAAYALVLVPTVLVARARAKDLEVPSLD